MDVGQVDRAEKHFARAALLAPNRPDVHLRLCMVRHTQGNSHGAVLAGQRAVEEVYQQVLSQWATAISAGGELSLEVEGLKPAAVVRLSKALKELEGVESVKYDISKGIARFRINAKMGGQELFERLAEEDFEKLIEIVDLKMNRIQAKAASE